MKRLLIPFALLTLLAAACAKGAEPGGTAASPTEHAGEHTTDPAAECTDLKGTGPAQIVLQDNAFDPACAVVSADQGLSLRNEGVALHSFTVENSDVDLDVAAGDTNNTEAIGGILEPGEYKVHCTYHVEMVAELHVE
jgi:plastocyanin